MTETEIPSLDEFVDLAALQASVSTAFPTVDSVRWYVRQNRAALVEEGALIIVAGRMRFNPPRFKLAVVSIGRKAAA
jgi:hypothetical protein